MIPESWKAPNITLIHKECQDQILSKNYCLILMINNNNKLSILAIARLSFVCNSYPNLVFFFSILIVLLFILNFSFTWLYENHFKKVLLLITWRISSPQLLLKQETLYHSRQVAIHSRGGI